MLPPWAHMDALESSRIFCAWCCHRGHIWMQWSLQEYFVHYFASMSTYECIEVVKNILCISLPPWAHMNALKSSRICCASFRHHEHTWMHWSLQEYFVHHFATMSTYECIEVFNNSLCINLPPWARIFCAWCCHHEHIWMHWSLQEYSVHHFATMSTYECTEVFNNILCINLPPWAHMNALKSSRILCASVWHHEHIWMHWSLQEYFVHHFATMSTYECIEVFKNILCISLPPWELMKSLKSSGVFCASFCHHEHIYECIEIWIFCACKMCSWVRMLLSMITQTKDREIINRVLKQSALTPRHLVDMWFWPTKYRFLSPLNNENINHTTLYTIDKLHLKTGERGGSVVECRTPEREVRGSRPTSAVLCPWARHFTPRKYWLNTQEAMAPSRHDWKIVDRDVKPQHNQPTTLKLSNITYQISFSNVLNFLLDLITTSAVIFILWPQDIDTDHR